METVGLKIVYLVRMQQHYLSIEVFNSKILVDFTKSDSQNKGWYPKKMAWSIVIPLIYLTMYFFNW